MVEVRQTETFDRWFRTTVGQRHVSRFALIGWCSAFPATCDRWAKGRGETLIVLLAGGDKGSQNRAISTALILARSL